MVTIKRLDDLKIEENNPFDNDELNRVDCAENLTTLIQASESPLVLAVNAPWGMGKSTFIKMWQQQLINKGHLTLYFNTWENDHCEKPMISFISEIGNLLGTLKLSKSDDSILSGKYEKVKKASFKVLKKIIPLGVKFATSGIIDIDPETDKSLDKFAEKFAEDSINEYQDMKNTIASFKNELADFANTVFEDDNTIQKPIVIFIDELDRCRPSFAIELLENVKHLFSVPGFVFVLGIDNEQLGHSIKSIYGSGMDSDGYLKRFFDLEFKLPDPDPELFAKFLSKKFKFKNYFKDGDSKQVFSEPHLVNTFVSFSKKYSLSLRAQVKCFIQLNIAIGVISGNDDIYPCYLTFLILLKNSEPEKYNKLTKELTFGAFDSGSINDLYDEIGFTEEFKQTAECQQVKAILCVTFLKQEAVQIIRNNLKNIMVNASISKEENKNAGLLLDLINTYEKVPDFRKIQEKLVTKIEFSLNFKQD